MERRNFLKTLGVITAAGVSGLTLLKATGCNVNDDNETTSNPTFNGKNWSPPEITDWTILPAAVTALAWTNKTYKEELLRNPNYALKKRFPNNINFKVYEDHDNIKYLNLPVKKSKHVDWKKEYFLEKLMAETRNDETFEFHLPPKVIAEALYNNSFKYKLLNNANEAIEILGFKQGNAELRVIENNESNYNLVLMQNPLHQERLDFDVLLERLRQTMGGNFADTGTTKCCASGTCDLIAC